MEEFDQDTEEDQNNQEVRSLDHHLESNKKRKAADSLNKAAIMSKKILKEPKSSDKALKLKQKKVSFSKTKKADKKKRGLATSEAATTITANGPSDVFGAKEHDHDLKLFKDKKKDQESENDECLKNCGNSFSEDTDE